MIVRVMAYAIRRFRERRVKVLQYRYKRDEEHMKTLLKFSACRQFSGYRPMSASQL